MSGGGGDKVPPGGGVGGNGKMGMALITMLLGCFGKSQGQDPGQNDPLSQLLGGGYPFWYLTGMLGGLELEGQKPMSGSGAPPFKPPTGSTLCYVVAYSGKAAVISFSGQL